MQFQLKITAITLIILILTLLLSSLLSIASFEKIYTASLISTYELAAKNLKRRIEPSLRFGKHLSNFRGMQRFLTPILEKTPDLSAVSIVSPEGEIYHDANPLREGQYLPHPPPQFTSSQSVHSALYNNRTYVTFVPLYNRQKKQVGAVYIAFSRDVIYKKVQEKIVESFNVLWVLLFASSAGLIIFMVFLIGKPLGYVVSEINQLLIWPPEKEREKLFVSPEKDNAELDETYSFDIVDTACLKIDPNTYFEIAQNQNELERLRWYVEIYVNHCYRTIRDAEHFKYACDIILDECQSLTQSEQSLRALLVEKKLDKNLRNDINTLTNLLSELNQIQLRQNLQDLLPNVPELQKNVGVIQTQMQDNEIICQLIQDYLQRVHQLREQIQSLLKQSQNMYSMD